MKSIFLNSEQSLELKELGFNSQCLGYYNMDPYFKTPIFTLGKPINHEWCLPAPLIQQAFRFFRKKYGLNCYIRNEEYDESSMCYEFVIDEDIYSDWFKTYEEAEQSCLDKLIELAKEK